MIKENFTKLISFSIMLMLIFLILFAFIAFVVGMLEPQLFIFYLPFLSFLDTRWKIILFYMAPGVIFYFFYVFRDGIKSSREEVKKLYHIINIFELYNKVICIFRNDVTYRGQCELCKKRTARHYGSFYYGTEEGTSLTGIKNTGARVIKTYQTKFKIVGSGGAQICSICVFKEFMLNFCFSLVMFAVMLACNWFLYTKAGSYIPEDARLIRLLLALIGLAFAAGGILSVIIIFGTITNLFNKHYFDSCAISCHSQTISGHYKYFTSSEYVKLKKLK